MQALINQGYRVIRIDNRDAGKSTILNTNTKKYPLVKALARAALGLGNRYAAYTVRDMTNDVHLFLSAIGVSKVHLVGGSMGGMIAQVLASKHPEQVQTLTLFFTSNLQCFSRPPYPKQLGLLLSGPKSGKEDDAVAYSKKFLKAIGTEQTHQEDELERFARTAYRRSYAPQGVVRQFQGILATGSLLRYNKATTQPTLVIHGSEDRLLPLGNGKRVARAIPNARLEIIPGMAHDIPLYFTPRVVDFMAQHIQRHSK